MSASVGQRWKGRFLPRWQRSPEELGPVVGSARGGPHRGERELGRVEKEVSWVHWDLKKLMKGWWELMREQRGWRGEEEERHEQRQSGSGWKEHEV